MKSTYLRIYALVILSISIILIGGFVNYEASVKKITVSEQFRCIGCNVLLISIDTLAKNHLPCYGYSKNTAPTICEIAKNGIIFDNYITHGHLTNTAMISMITSKYPTQSGLTNFFSNIKPEIKTMAEIFKQNDYTNYGYGSAPELSDKKLYGFFKSENEGNYPSFKRGYEYLEYSGDRDIPYDFLKLMDKYKSTKSLGWVSIGTVHFPYSYYGAGYKESEFFNSNYNGPLKQFEYIDYNSLLSRIYNNKYYPLDGSSPITLTKEDIEYIYSKYDYGIKYSDDFVKSIFNKLKENGQLDNTLVIIHGVHGEEMGASGYYGHYDLTENEMNTALIIYNPKSNITKRITSLVRGVDFLPTLIDIVGMKKGTNINMEGISVIDMIDKDATYDRYAFMERTPIWEDLRRWSNKEHKYVMDKAIEVIGDRTTGDTGVRWKDYLLIHRRSRNIENQVTIWNFLEPNLINRDNEFELYRVTSGVQKRISLEDSQFENLKKELLLFESNSGIEYGD